LPVELEQLIPSGISNVSIGVSASHIKRPVLELHRLNGFGSAIPSPLLSLLISFSSLNDKVITSCNRDDSVHGGLVDNVERFSGFESVFLGKAFTIDCFLLVKIYNLPSLISSVVPAVHLKIIAFFVTIVSSFDIPDLISMWVDEVSSGELEHLVIVCGSIGVGSISCEVTTSLINGVVILLAYNRPGLSFE